MFFILWVLLKLKVKWTRTLRNFLCKSTKWSLSSHSHTWGKTYKLKFAIAWTHFSKIIRSLLVNTIFSIFPNIEHTTHKTVDIQCYNILIIFFQLICNRLIFRVFCLENKTCSWLLSFDLTLNFLLFDFNIWNFQPRVLFIHGHTIQRLLYRSLFFHKFIIQLRSYLHSMN